MSTTPSPVRRAPARIFDTFAGIDILDSPPSTTVLGRNLRPGMVLLDDLGTPAAGIDHRTKASRGSGDVAFLAWNLETGQIQTLRLRPKNLYPVIAKPPTTSRRSEQP